MRKTDVDNIMQASPGVLVRTGDPSANEIQRRRMASVENRINKMETDISSIKEMLSTLISLQKVNG